MTWDGIPEHRNLGGDGDRPASAADYLREMGERLRRKPSAWACAKCGGITRRAVGGHLEGDAREVCAACGWPSGAPYERPSGDVPEMPADPFGGMTAEATAIHEIFRSLNAGGFTEQQALFYIACLMQVGNAMKAGGLLPPEEDA